jgi:hypothetical protein
LCALVRKKIKRNKQKKCKGASAFFFNMFKLCEYG